MQLDSHLAEEREMAQNVRFFVQRHGEHQDDCLSVEGRQQVSNAAIKHLRDVEFHYAFASEEHRAQQTARVALAAIGQEDVAKGLQRDPGFGYRFAEDPRWPHEALLQEIEKAKRAERKITVGFVLNELRHPPSLRAAGGLLMTMQACARHLTYYRPGRSTNVLVGGHGTNVLATRFPELTPLAEYADIMCYEFDVDVVTKEPHLTNSRYMPAVD